MALLGMISGDVTMGSDFMLSVPVVYFDDSDPDNDGYLAGHLPRVVAYHWVFKYPVTLQGADLQTQVQADVKAKGKEFEAAVTASVTAKSLLPVGALVTIDS